MEEMKKPGPWCLDTGLYIGLILPTREGAIKTFLDFSTRPSPGEP